MSTAMQQTQRPRNQLSAWVQEESTRRQIAAAVGDKIDAEQFASHMIVALNRPEFDRCTNPSKARAVLECAALGLLPTAGQVVLIKYKDELKAMPQWQGYKAVMERHPAVLEVQAFLVHNSDAFLVDNGHVDHQFNPLDPKRTFHSVADLQGGYCKIIYRDGRPPRYHFTTAEAIKKAQGCAQTQNVWKQWFEQMALKTLYRDCYARRAVPVDPLVSATLERITQADDVILGNDPRSTAIPEGTRSERFLSRLSPEPDYAESTDPHEDIAEAAAAEVAAGPNGTDGAEVEAEEPKPKRKVKAKAKAEPDSTPDDRPSESDAIRWFEAALGKCWSLPDVDATLAELEGEYAWLSAKAQDRVREKAAEVKATLRRGDTK